MTMPPLPPFENTNLWADAVMGLARSALNSNPGSYWTYFNRVAGRSGVSAVEMARALAAIAHSSPEAAAALNGLRQVVQYGIVGGETATAITESVVMAEAAATGIGTAAVGVETVTIAAETTVAVSESGGFFSALRALLGGLATWVLYATVVIGASYFIAQKIGRVQCHVVVVNGKRSACNCINDSFIPSFFLDSMKAKACGSIHRRLN